MKILCAKSSIEFEASYFPFTLSSRECSHPVFSIPQKKLLPLIAKYHAGEFTATDSYLYYLALFNSTELVHFRSPAIQTAHTSSIVAKGIETLHELVGMINAIGYEKVKGILHLPQFVISNETKDLSSSGMWLKLWEEAMEEYERGYVKADAQEKKKRRAEVLEKYIRDKSKDISQYSVQLAEWAAFAGNLYVEHDYYIADGTNNDAPILLHDYWKNIIKRCAKGDGLFDIPEYDLDDMINYFEGCIDDFDLCSHTLLNLLRTSLDRKRNYLEFRDVDLNPDGMMFRILDPESNVADANMLAIIDSAPKYPPVRSNYPSNIAFLRAKMNYQMATEYNAELAKHQDVMIEADAVTKINQEPYDPPIIKPSDDDNDETEGVPA